MITLLWYVNDVFYARNTLKADDDIISDNVISYVPACQEYIHAIANCWGVELIQMSDLLVEDVDRR